MTIIIVRSPMDMFYTEIVGDIDPNVLESIRLKEGWHHKDWNYVKHLKRSKRHITLINLMVPDVLSLICSEFNFSLAKSTIYFATPENEFFILYILQKPYSSVESKIHAQETVETEDFSVDTKDLYRSQLKDESTETEYDKRYNWGPITKPEKDEKAEKEKKAKLKKKKKKSKKSHKKELEDVQDSIKNTEDTQSSQIDSIQVKEESVKATDESILTPISTSTNEDINKIVVQDDQDKKDQTLPTFQENIQGRNEEENIESNGKLSLKICQDESSKVKKVEEQPTESNKLETSTVEENEINEALSKTQMVEEDTTTDNTISETKPKLETSISADRKKSPYYDSKMDVSTSTRDQEDVAPMKAHSATSTQMDKKDLMLQTIQREIMLEMKSKRKDKSIEESQKTAQPTTTTDDKEISVTPEDILNDLSIQTQTKLSTRIEKTIYSKSDTTMLSTQYHKEKHSIEVPTKNDSLTQLDTINYPPQVVPSNILTEGSNNQQNSEENQNVEVNETAEKIEATPKSEESQIDTEQIEDKKKTGIKLLYTTRCPTEDTGFGKWFLPSPIQYQSSEDESSPHIDNEEKLSVSAPIQSQPEDESLMPMEKERKWSPIPYPSPEVESSMNKNEGETVSLSPAIQIQLHEVESSRYTDENGIQSRRRSHASRRQKASRRKKYDLNEVVDRIGRSISSSTTARGRRPTTDNLDIPQDQLFTSDDSQVTYVTSESLSKSIFEYVIDIPKKLTQKVSSYISGSWSQPSMASSRDTPLTSAVHPQLDSDERQPSTSFSTQQSTQIIFVPSQSSIKKSPSSSHFGHMRRQGSDKTQPSTSKKYSGIVELPNVKPEATTSYHIERETGGSNSSSGSRQLERDISKIALPGSDSSDFSRPLSSSSSHSN